MTEELEHFKKIYKYAHINDELWQDMYQKASEDKNNKVASNIHLLVFDYLKENMNVSIIIDYLKENIKLFEGESLTTGKRKLNTLFSFIERTNYELTDKDIRYLLERKEISNLFEKIFKKDKITEDKLASITLEDMNYELLCRTYLDSKEIEIIEINDEYQDLKERKTLNHNEQIELIKKAQMKDNDALTKLIIYNKGLVNKIAGKYSYRCNECFSHEDLVSVGNMGLLKAIERFDVSKNISFSTYATHWIRCYITRELDELGTSIRLPVYMTYLKKHIDAYKAYIYQTEGRKVTDEELIKKFDTTAETLKRMNTLPEYTSLNDQVKDEKDGDELKEFIPDEHVDVEEEALNAVSKEELIKVIESLPKSREQEIIKLRFGFTDGNFHTLEEVAKKYNLTRERIRQIEAKALKKLEIILTSKKRIQEVEEHYIHTSNNRIFDYHTIHQDLSKSVYMKLVSILPNNEKNIYCAIRGIKNNNIYIVNENNIGEKEQKFALLVDTQILEMYNYFSNYQKRKPKETEENILNKTINYMSRIYLLFHFPEVSQKKLVEIVKQLSNNEKEAMYLKHGTSLMEHHQINDDKKKVYSYNGYKSITKKINGNNIETSLLLTNKTGLSIEELQKRIKYLNAANQEILVKRHGKNLNELLPFDSKQYHNQYAKYIKALQILTEEPFIYENKETIKNTKKCNNNIFETSLLLTNKTGLSIEELQKRIKYLNVAHQEVLVIRHGKNLNELLPFDSKQYHNQYAKYIKALQILTEEPFICETKKGLKVKETSNKTLEELTNLSLSELQKRLTFMRIAQQKALTKRFGPNLDKILPYENNRHYQNCWRAVKYIKSNSAKNNKIIDNKTLTEITGLSIEELQKRLKFLCLSQQQTLIKRFGSSLVEVLPYEDKKHYVNCLNTIKAISKEPFEYKERKRKVSKNHNKIGDKTLTEITNLSLEELQKRLKSLRISQQQTLIKRFGPNLDQVLPYEDNKHYLNCWKNIKCIKKEPFNYKERKRKISKNHNKIGDKMLTEITNLSLEELQKRLKSLRIFQQQTLTKRFGPNLDQVLPYEDNKHYLNCWRTIKRIMQEPFECKDKKAPKKSPSKKKEIKNDEKSEVAIYFENKIKPFSYQEIIKEIPELSKEDQDIIYMRHGSSIDKILPFKKDYPLSVYQEKYQIALNNLAKIVRRKRQEQIILEIINCDKTNQKMQTELKNVKENKVKASKIPEVKTANKVVKEVNNLEKSNEIKDKKANLKKAKEKLTKQSQNNIENQIKAKVYDKFNLIYQNILDEKYLEKVINESYKECIEKENTNLELSLSLKVERNILLYLKEIYNSNKDNDKGLELAISIEDMIYKSLKERYSYISEKDLRSAISKAFINFSGARSINIDIALILKKQR